MNLDYTSGFANQINSALDRVQRTNEIAFKGNDPLHQMQQALTIENAMRAKQEYERNMTPRKVQDIVSQFPEWAREGAMGGMKSLGIVRSDGQTEYVTDKDAREFMSSADKNLVFKAKVATEGIQGLHQKMAPLMKQIEADHKVVNDWTNYFDDQDRTLREEAQTTGKPLNMEKLKSIAEKKAKWQAESEEFKRLPELTKQTQYLQSQVEQAMKVVGIADDQYKEILKKVGGDPTLAQMVAMNPTMMDYALKVKNKREADEATAKEQAKYSATSGMKLRDEAKRLQMQSDKEVSVAARKKALGVGDEGKPEVTPKEARAQIDKLDRMMMTLDKGSGEDIAREGGLAGFTINLSSGQLDPAARKQYKAEVLKKRAYYYEFLSPQAKKAYNNKATNISETPRYQQLIDQVVKVIQVPGADKAGALNALKKKLKAEGYTDKQLNSDPYFVKLFQGNIPQ